MKRGCQRLLTVFTRPLDSLVAFENNSPCENAVIPTRYAVRQAMDQEYQKYALRKQAEARQARYKASSDDGPSVEAQPCLDHETNPGPSPSQQKPPQVKRDFFGRPMSSHTSSAGDTHGFDAYSRGAAMDSGPAERKVWISFHEGFSNAVRKPITLDELLRDFETSGCP